MKKLMIIKSILLFSIFSCVENNTSNANAISSETYVPEPYMVRKNMTIKQGYYKGKTFVLEAIYTNNDDYPVCFTTYGRSAPGLWVRNLAKADILNRNECFWNEGKGINIAFDDETSFHDRDPKKKYIQSLKPGEKITLRAIIPPFGDEVKSKIDFDRCKAEGLLDYSKPVYISASAYPHYCDDNYNAMHYPEFVGNPKAGELASPSYDHELGPFNMKLYFENE